MGGLPQPVSAPFLLKASLWSTCHYQAASNLNCSRLVFWNDEWL